jgi:hypothetical protein
MAYSADPATSNQSGYHSIRGVLPAQLALMLWLIFEEVDPTVSHCAVRPNGS